MTCPSPLLGWLWISAPKQASKTNKAQGPRAACSFSQRSVVFALRDVRLLNREPPSSAQASVHSTQYYVMEAAPGSFMSPKRRLKSSARSSWSRPSWSRPSWGCPMLLLYQRIRMGAFYSPLSSTIYPVLVCYICEPGVPCGELASSTIIRWLTPHSPVPSCSRSLLLSSEHGILEYY
jgi:hypothetical protein